MQKPKLTTVDVTTIPDVVRPYLLTPVTEAAANYMQQPGVQEKYEAWLREKAMRAEAAAIKNQDTPTTTTHRTCPKKTTLKIYKTDTARYILSENDLDYAMQGETVVMTTVHPKHIATIMDAPDYSMITCIQLAANIASIDYTQATHGENLTDTINRVASEAAAAHMASLEVQALQPNTIPAAYPHIYTTNHGRVAISQRRLFYATATANPAELREEAIHKDDLSATCMLTDYHLATLLAKATSGTFHDASGRGCPHHNAVLIDPADESACIVRTDTGYVPLADALAHSNEREKRMYLAAFEMQRQICNLYLALTQQPVAS